MKLYTKQGDDGETGLAGGSRVRKNDPRVAAIGALDETNAAIGMAAATCVYPDLTEKLATIQSDLFSIGAELSGAGDSIGKDRIGSRAISQLEEWIDAATGETPPLRHFVLPGGSPLAAALHLARCICRRAEREIVGVSSQSAVRGEIIQYANRLSDYLFAAARLANHRGGKAEATWPPPA